MTLSNELKTAILQMPQKEKDKLLLRLVAKNDLLVAQLHHKLLEDSADAESQKNELLQGIRQYLTDERTKEWNYTPGLLMMALRDCSGKVTHHVKVTKDKMGEIELTILVVNLAFEQYAPMLEREKKRAETFAEYVVKKADFVMKKLQKIDEDYYMDFAEEVNKMLDFIANYDPCQTAAKNLSIQLPKIWEW